MPLEFHCPHCQTLVRMPDHARGKRGRCPHCKEINDIPAHSEPEAEKPAPAPLPKPAAEQPKPAPVPKPAAEKPKPAPAPASAPLTKPVPRQSNSSLTPLDPLPNPAPATPGPLDLLSDLPQTPGLTPIGGPYGDPLGPAAGYGAPGYGAAGYGGSGGYVAGGYGGGYVAPAASSNPYLSPAYAPANYGRSQSSSGFDELRPLDESGRPGLPWEDRRRDNTLFETVKQVVMEPAYAFGNMHRTGGLGRPLSFAVYCSLIVGSANVGYKAIFDLLMTIPFLAFARVTEELTLFVFASIGINLVLGLVAVAIFGSLGAIFGAFVHAGILHLVLMMLNGARARFEATFRLTCYVQGSVGMINLIPLPCLSQLGAIVMYFVVMIIGVRWTHEISVGKSVAAVVITFFASILLVVIPVFLMFAFLFFLFGLIITAAAQGMR